MSAAMHSPPERRQYNQHLVSELQEERQQVWALYCKVGELKPFSCTSQTQSLLTQFSQLLIDYVSLGHFGLYEHLLAGKERRNAVLTVAEDMYPDFTRTTDAVVSFNDKYDDSKQALVVDHLEADLSLLGENLAKRIDLEDKLCRLMMEKTE